MDVFPDGFVEEVEAGDGGVAEVLFGFFDALGGFVVVVEDEDADVLWFVGGGGPDVAALVVVLDGLFDVGDVLGAVEVVGEHDEEGLVFDEWFAVIDGVGDSGWFVLDGDVDGVVFGVGVCVAADESAVAAEVFGGGYDGDAVDSYLV